jgi:hypothetical protein
MQGDNLKNGVEDFLKGATVALIGAHRARRASSLALGRLGLILRREPNADL